MRILSIETSCDETGVAIVEGTNLPARKEGTPEGFAFSTLGAALLSQAELHAEFGGVYPNLAKREHIKNLPVILEQALQAAGTDVGSIDAIAVTYGPGLEPALWTGIEFAKKLAAEYNLPLLATNHMEGHLISSLTQNGTLEKIHLPVLGLLISGGHTEFVLMKEWFEYEIIGQTLDDAVGEAFDKVARMLELPYPGGPHISRTAREAREKNLTSEIQLPRPMLSVKNCDVSFSGLKTAALYALRGKTLNDDEKSAFAREFEDAVTEIIVSKTRRALTETGAMTFVIGGGVAANTHIRNTLVEVITKEFPNVEVRLPELSITGDNAIMIAQAALARSLSGKSFPETEGLRAMGHLALGSKIS